MDISFLFCVCVAYNVLSLPCSLVVTYLERVDFLALLYVMFSCVFVSFPLGFLGQVGYLIISIPDLDFFPTLSFVKLLRPLIASGMLVYNVKSKLLVSLGNFLNGSKTTHLTEDNV